MRSSAFGAILALACGLAVVVTAEFVLRDMHVQPGNGEQRSLHVLRLDRPWLYGLRPGARVAVPSMGDVVYEINADGFRDRSFPAAASGETFRILALGASITFGWGVNEQAAYPGRLEQLLVERGVKDAEVLNLGVNGYNAYNQAALLTDVGLAYQPDLVLAEFCVAGLQDPALHFDVQTRLHLGMIPAEAFPDPSLRREPPRFAGLLRACRRLRTCSLLDDALLAYAERERNPAEILSALRPLELPPGPTRGWLQARYGEMARAADSANAAFGVIAFPYRSQIDGADSGRLQEQVVEVAGELARPALDLVPVFRRAKEAGAPPLFLDAWHPSAAGHEVAAEAIVAWLEAETLLPSVAAVSAPGTRRGPPEASP